MKCNQVKLNVENYLDGEMPILQLNAVSGHVKTCESCRSVLTSEEMLRQALRCLPAADVNPRFIKKAMNTASKSQASESWIHRYFMPGVTSAVTASLAIWFLTSGTVMQTTAVPEDGSFPLISMAIHETRTVQMVFNSPDDFKAVSFKLSLPEGFEVAGYPGNKELDWKVDIKKGSNVLSLPIIALIAGKGELVAHIAHIDKTKSFRLRVNSENMKVLTL